MITRIVKLTFKKEMIEDFLKIFDQIKEQVRDQPGCHDMKLVREINNDTIFMTISNWDDERDLNNYRDTQFFRSTWSTIKPWFDNKPEAWSTKTV